MRRCLIIFFLCAPFLLRGEESIDSLLEALEIAEYWDKKMNARFPVTFNHILSTGYFTTPSARMTCSGNIGFGIADVPPYLHWNGRVQPFNHLELSLSYRIFRGVEDPGLSPFGFGDYADRGANFKYAFITPEDTMYRLPGIAFGIDDFMGSKKFTTYFIVGTQVFQNHGLEVSFGWGTRRFDGPSNGFFGGINWFPLFNCENKWIKGICFTAEYDPTDYEDPHKEPHPDARKVSSRINYGLKYNVGDFLELSASRIRGEEFAFAGSLHFNIGEMEGILPKIGDPVPYTSPVDMQPLGCYRPESIMIQSMNYAFDSQGFQLTKAWMEECPDFCGGTDTRLWLALINCRYRQEHVVRMRIQHLLASLTPSNVSEIVVVIESYGLPCQQYVYNRELLLKYANHCIGPYEFDLITPRREASCPNPEFSRLIFYNRQDLWKGRIGPRYETFFGSSRGKFKYDLGPKVEIEGFLPRNIYYEAQVSYTMLSTINDLSDYDFFNPSQLPNVGTDYIRYRQQSNFTWDRLYLQKSWNLCHGLFWRAALGYFQVNYGGVAGELLWYPASCYFAIGLEGAILKKRRYHGLGFQSKLRHFEGFTPVYSPYSTLQQYFLSLYLDFPDFYFFTKISVGQFLARDKGLRLEATRYFDNGIRFTLWITYTNAHDVVNGENFFNRGFAVELPFDLFYKCSSRRIWNYGMAAWLRDAGYFTSTGVTLFDVINRERRW